MKSDTKQLSKIFEFNEYMHSQKWLDLKQERLKFDNFKCVLCGSTDKLICHHITYLRLFDEDIKDVITLCSRCHVRVHRVSPPINTPSFVRQDAICNAFNEEVFNII